MSDDRAIPLAYLADMKWVDENYVQLLSEYENLWVAVVDGQVAAACPGLGQAKRLAAKRTGKVSREIYAEFMAGGSAGYGTGAPLV